MVVRARRRPREETLADFAALPEEERARPRLITGHTVFGLHALVPRPAVYITMLRNPTALVLSQHAFVQRTPGHRHHELATAMSLDEYVRCGLFLETDNSQTRAVAGDMGTPFGECSEAMLDTAKSNLEQHFGVVGLTERFDESLILLRRTFGWKHIRYVRANVAPGRRLAPSPETLALIEHRNRFDIELYRFAEERFQRTIDAIPSFADEYTRFLRSNAVYRPWGHVTYTLPARVRNRLLPRDGVRR